MNGRNVAHWACTLLAMVVAIFSVVKSTNLEKQLNDLKQQVSVKADTSAVNTKFDARDALYQQDVAAINQRLVAVTESIVSTREYAEQVDAGLTDLDDNVMSLRKRLGFAGLQPSGSIPDDVINELAKDLAKLVQEAQSLQTADTDAPGISQKELDEIDTKYHGLMTDEQAKAWQELYETVQALQWQVLIDALQSPDNQPEPQKPKPEKRSP